jgi:hypothetical protein
MIMVIDWHGRGFEALEHRILNGIDQLPAAMGCNGRTEHGRPIAAFSRAVCSRVLR